jgi:hypothetical protein
MGVSCAVCPFGSVLCFCSWFTFEFVIALVWEIVLFIPHRTFPPFFLLVLMVNTYSYYDASGCGYVCKLLGQEVKKMTMHEYFERLTNYLLEKNPSLAYAQARTWVELLWEDFETTYARAGHEYRGKELTEKVVRQWIDRYGATLHEFQTNNPKYKHLLNRDDYQRH